MAIEFPYGLEHFFPAWPITNAKSAIFNDADGEKFASHTRISYAGEISKIHIPLINVGQAPVNGIKISFQGRSRAGNDVFPNDTPTHYRVIPQGSIAQLATVVTPVITDDGTDIGNKKTVAVGDYLTVVAEFENFVAGDSLSYLYINGYDRTPGVVGKAWISWNVGGGWASATAQTTPWLLEYADGTIKAFSEGLHCVGSSVALTPTYTSVSSPNEYGAKFIAPLSGKIGGLVNFKNYAGGSVIDTLYDSSNNMLAQFTTDIEDEIGYINVQNDKVWFDTPASVIEGEIYRLAHKPSGAATAYFYYHTYGTDAAAQILGGSNFMLTERTDSGAWTDTPTKKPDMSPFYTEFESGNGVVVPQGLHMIDNGIIA